MPEEFCFFSDRNGDGNGDVFEDFEGDALPGFKRGVAEEFGVAKEFACFFFFAFECFREALEEERVLSFKVVEF